MLLLSTLLALASLYPFYKKQHGLAVSILFLAALLLRYHYIALDPFLHDWDERYHALVAKNMIQNPLKPMLRLHPALEYDFTHWSNNQVWLHKQPLFLWQMALSMWLFGVNEIALRLPNMLMGSLSVLLVYRIGSIFTNKNVGFLAAFITVFARYQLELVSGSMGIDHNDLAFMFYTTASIWAYSEYKNHEYETTEKDTPKTAQWKWLLAIGVFSGAAILCKWLTGILVFSGWGIALLTQKENRRQLKNWLHIFSAFAISCAVFLPWQVYIHLKFPAESAYERAYSSKHFTEAIEGHGGGGLFYIEHSALYYGYIGAFFAAIGLLLFIILRQKISKFWIECLVFILLPYLFFSAAATKMQTFVYVISPLLHICIALAIYYFYEYLNKITQHNATQFAIYLCLLGVSYGIFHAPDTGPQRGTAEFKAMWFVKQKRASIYKSLKGKFAHRTVVINATNGGDIDMMFYTNYAAYDFITEEQYDKLKKGNMPLAAFATHKGGLLPNYIQQDSNIVVIPDILE